VTIDLPFHLYNVTFAPDGKSLYGVVAESVESNVERDAPGLSRIEFNPTRVSPVLGTTGFAIRSYAFSSRQDKLVISGSVSKANERRCGVFEILVSYGTIRQVLSSDCHNPPTWDNLSLSSDGEEAIATTGSNKDDLHLEQIDLVQGTIKSVGGDFWMGVLSPDGKWIIARDRSPRADKIFLIDTADFSNIRAFAGGVKLTPTWSPDSRYLLLWKDYLFRCGIYPVDLGTPATLETLDIQTGKRSVVSSSKCQINGGPTGWVSHELVSNLPGYIY
jgi:Tol biopolymer transport system component